MQIWGVGRGEFVHHIDDDGNEWLWALCEVAGCPNNVCARMNDRFCWPHLVSGGSALVTPRAENLPEEPRKELVTDMHDEGQSPDPCHPR